MTVPQRNKHTYNMTQIFHSKELNPENNHQWQYESIKL